MTLETILKTVLHAVAWSALVVFCGVVAGVGVRWMLRKLGDALSETVRRHGKWAAMTLTSVALVCGVVGDKNATNEPPNGVPAPTPMMTAARGAPETFPLHLGSAARGAPQTFPPRLAAQRPDTAQDVEEWKLRGAYDDAIRELQVCVFISPLANPVKICDNQRRCLPIGRDYREAEDVLRLK